VRRFGEKSEMVSLQSEGAIGYAYADVLGRQTEERGEETARQKRQKKRRRKKKKKNTKVSIDPRRLVWSGPLQADAACCLPHPLKETKNGSTTVGKTKERRLRRRWTRRETRIATKTRSSTPYAVKQDGGETRVGVGTMGHKMGQSGNVDVLCRTPS
jgi:hypothetical protein